MISVLTQLFKTLLLVPWESQPRSTQILSLHFYLLIGLLLAIVLILLKFLWIVIYAISWIQGKEIEH